MTVEAKGDRRAFLARVRERVHAGLPQNTLRPVVAEPRPSPIAYAAKLDDLVRTFTETLEALTGTVEDASDPVTLVQQVVRRHDVRRAVVSRDPECEGIEDILLDTGVELAELGDTAACASADLGVTGAAFGVALTGSVVVDSTRAGARSASLLPATHLALLPRNAIVPNVGDILRELDTRLPRGLPSNLVFITGPSKSADIELILTVGVHGPRRLIVGLL